MGMVVTVPADTEVPMPDNRTRDTLNDTISNNPENIQESIGSLNIMYLIDDIWKGFKRFFWIIPNGALISDFIRLRAVKR